jgi:hypothetical protein
MNDYLCPFVLLAALFTLFYFFRAVSITNEFVEREKYDREKNPNQFNNERFLYNQRWVNQFHQIWFNVLGSVIGWAALYYLLDKVIQEGISKFGAEQFIALVIAYLGITGHLPQVALLGRLPGR